MGKHWYPVAHGLFDPAWFKEKSMDEQEWLSSADPQRMLDYLLGINHIPHGLLYSRGHALRQEVRHETGKRRAEVTDRKLRLFCCACCRLRGTPADVVDGYEMNGPPIDEYDRPEYRHTDEMWARGWTERGVSKPPLTFRAAILRDVVGNPFRPVTLPEVVVGKRNARGKLISDMPSWWDHPSVAALALAAYAERAGRACGRCVAGVVAWGEAQGTCPDCGGSGTVSDGTLDPGRLEILADAAEDAGCDDVVILNHLRGREPCSCLYDYGAPPNTPQCSSGWLKKRGPCVRGCWVLDLFLGKE